MVKKIFMDPKVLMVLADFDMNNFAPERSARLLVTSSMPG